MSVIVNFTMRFIVRSIANKEIHNEQKVWKLQTCIECLKSITQSDRVFFSPCARFFHIHRIGRCFDWILLLLIDLMLYVIWNSKSDMHALPSHNIISSTFSLGIVEISRIRCCLLVLIISIARCYETFLSFAFVFHHLFIFFFKSIYCAFQFTLIWMSLVINWMSLRNSFSFNLISKIEITDIE